MKKRVITQQQERALRLVHHDFGGMTQAEAAEKMGVNQSVICRLLAEVKKVLPEWFPILTSLEAECYHHLTVNGWSVQGIALLLDTAPDSVYQALQRCKDKDMPFTDSHGKILRYDEGMDAEVKTKF